MDSREFTLRLAHAKWRADQKVKAITDEAAAAKTAALQMKPDDV